MNIKGNHHYIVDAEGNRVAVLLDISTFEKILEAYEELEDKKAYDEIKETIKSELAAGQFSTLDEYLSMKEQS